MKGTGLDERSWMYIMVMEGTGMERIIITLAFADGSMSTAVARRRAGESRLDVAETVAKAAGATDYDYGTIAEKL